MTPRKIAGVLLGFGGVAVMIGPTCSRSIGTDTLAQLACVVASCPMRWPGLGPAVQGAGPSPCGQHRPADRRRDR
jgi:drug/metabolite transporter (DMT)-like permease